MGLARSWVEREVGSVATCILTGQPCAAVQIPVSQTTPPHSHVAASARQQRQLAAVSSCRTHQVARGDDVRLQVVASLGCLPLGLVVRPQPPHHAPRSLRGGAAGGAQFCLRSELAARRQAVIIQRPCASCYGTTNPLPTQARRPTIPPPADPPSSPCRSCRVQTGRPSR